jgi:hypothetical protein
VDLDPHGPALFLVGLIRIRIHIGNDEREADPGGQKSPAKIEIENLENLCF